MIDVNEALELILSRVVTLPPVRSRAVDASGQVLAEEVASDVDSPPHNKALMDGYALRSQDIRDDVRSLRVIEQVVAGAVPTQPVTPGTATRIMTGAPIPAGADCVVMVEETVPADEQGEVAIQATVVRSGQNIMRLGQAMRRGDVVLKAGQTLSAIQVGLLAEVGRAEVNLYPRPVVAVLSTGDELVAAHERPGPGQIRNSNGPMLEALVKQAGGRPINLGVARDDHRSMKELIQRGLEADVLVLSGGVSAGVLDLTPRLLAEVGVEEVFHKVRLKPGKPLWFGLAGSGEKPSLVFGLPGNPVSSLVCFELFVRPAIGRLRGQATHQLFRREAVLLGEYRQRGDRPTYFPAVVSSAGATLQIRTLDWQGSADLRTLSEANGLAVFPGGKEQFHPGDTVEVLYLE